MMTRTLSSRTSVSVADIPLRSVVIRLCEHSATALQQRHRDSPCCHNEDDDPQPWCNLYSDGEAGFERYSHREMCMDSLLSAQCHGSVRVHQPRERIRG